MTARGQREGRRADLSPLLCEEGDHRHRANAGAGFTGVALGGRPAFGATLIRVTCPRRRRRSSSSTWKLRRRRSEPSRSASFLCWRPIRRRSGSRSSRGTTNRAIPTRTAPRGSTRSSSSPHRTTAVRRRRPNGSTAHQSSPCRRGRSGRSPLSSTGGRRPRFRGSTG